MARLGDILGPSWALLGPSWPSWRPSWTSWRPLEPSLGPLRAVLGASGAVLGPLWGLLERSWGHLGGLLGALEGLLGPSWRRSVKRGGVLPFGPPLGGHDPREGCQKMTLPMSEKAPSDTSRHPPSRSRGGGRGRGKPLPEGEEGVVEEGRGLALDHLSPRGLVGLFRTLLGNTSHRALAGHWPASARRVLTAHSPASDATLHYAPLLLPLLLRGGAGAACSASRGRCRVPGSLFVLDHCRPPEAAVGPRSRKKKPPGTRDLRLSSGFFFMRLEAQLRIIFDSS